MPLSKVVIDRLEKLAAVMDGLDQVKDKKLIGGIVKAFSVMSFADNPDLNEWAIDLYEGRVELAGVKPMVMSESEKKLFKKFFVKGHGVGEKVDPTLVTELLDWVENG